MGVNPKTLRISTNFANPGWKEHIVFMPFASELIADCLFIQALVKGEVQKSPESQNLKE